MSNMKFKPDVEETATSDFWYDLFEGGYLLPSKFLADDEMAKRCDDARNLLLEFKRAMYDCEIIEDM